MLVVLTPRLCAGRLERVLEACGRSLTPHVYTFITFTESQQRSQPPGKADPAVKRARVLRQTRLIPVLICNIEKFEKHLIALGKRTKLELHAGVKMSTSRDFRIIQATLQAALERAASSEDEDGDALGTENRASRQEHAEGQPAPSQLSQGVSRLTRPSQKASRLSRSQKLSRPAAKRAKVEK